MEEYSLTLEEMMATGAALSAFGISLTIVIATFAFFALCALVLFIASRIPYCKMAKKEGISNRWLLWIPIAEMYIRLQLSKREYNLFNLIKVRGRTKVFWFYLIFNLVMIFLSIGLAIIMFVSLMLPFVGLFALMALEILWLVYYIVISIVGWRVNYDILMTYGMQKYAMWASIVNCFIPCLMIVFSYIIMDKEPDYNL